MLYYSTRNPAHQVFFREAVLNPLAPDGGLYMPADIPLLPPSFFKNLPSLSFPEIGFEAGKTFFHHDIPHDVLQTICEDSFTFPAPLVYLDDFTASLELWHGPTRAFKDFGARFMARVMAWLTRGENRETLVLVATSGDTGGAVAAGFYNVPGIKVVILYPSGRVSPVQEKQLTSWGGNITALEVQGSFDDCQALVKNAFSDPELTRDVQLSSANSINIARLLPQIFYYFEAYKQLRDKKLPITIAVPSGNFGNLTAGLIAKKMGLPVHKFIAATNANNVVPRYLSHGVYQPRAVIPTISNAMDVSAPSNFERILTLYGSTWNHLTSDVFGFWLDDTGTRKAIRELYKNYRYLADPHGAIAYQSLKSTFNPANKLFIETAHPSKFTEIMEEVVGFSIPYDEQENMHNKSLRSTLIDNSYTKMKNIILSL